MVTRQHLRANDVYRNATPQTLYYISWAARSFPFTLIALLRQRLVSEKANGNSIGGRHSFRFESDECEMTDRCLNAELNQPLLISPVLLPETRSVHKKCSVSYWWALIKNLNGSMRTQSPSFPSSPLRKPRKTQGMLTFGNLVWNLPTILGKSNTWTALDGRGLKNNTVFAHDSMT